MLTAVKRTNIYVRQVPIKEPKVISLHKTLRQRERKIEKSGEKEGGRGQYEREKVGKDKKGERIEEREICLCNFKQRRKRRGRDRETKRQRQR